MDPIERDAGLKGIGGAGPELPELQEGRLDSKLAAAADPSMFEAQPGSPTFGIPAIDFPHRPFIPTPPGVQSRLESCARRD